jgi:prepilin peptidase CpaA
VVIFGVGSLAVGLLLYAALHDIAARTVPNWLPLGVFLLGCAWRVMDRNLLSGLIIAGSTFAVLFAVWLLGGIGGGDVKLWPAAATLIPPHLQPELDFFLRVFIIGGGLGLMYLALWLVIPKRRLAASGPRGGLLRRIARVERWRIGRRGPLPYALAISGGAIMTIIPFSLQH